MVGRSSRSPGHTPMRDYLPQTEEASVVAKDYSMEEAGMLDCGEGKYGDEDAFTEALPSPTDFHHDPGDDIMSDSGRKAPEPASLKAVDNHSVWQENTGISTSGNGLRWPTNNEGMSEGPNKRNSHEKKRTNQKEKEGHDTVKSATANVMAEPKLNSGKGTGNVDGDEQDMEIDDLKTALCNAIEEEDGDDDKHSSSHESLNESSPQAVKDDGNEMEEEMLAIMAMDTNPSDNVASEAYPSRTQDSKSNPLGSSPLSMPSRRDPESTDKHKIAPKQFDQDAMVVDAPNDMEKDFFLDDDMDAGPPSVHPPDATPNDIASHSTSSSGTSSSSDASSSSGEEPVAGEPMSEPEVDRF